MTDDSTVTEMLRLFSNGGPVMFMLSFIAAILYTTATAALFFVYKGNLNIKRQGDWVDWISDPEAGEGRAGEIIRYATHGPRISIKTVQRRFDEIREVIISSIDRRLIVVTTLIAVAPMTGLLGTVGGMIEMFDGMATSTGKKNMEKLQSGMYQSLLCPLTGLTIALPGMFMALLIRQKRNWIVSILAQLESAIVRVRFKGV